MAAAIDSLQCAQKPIKRCKRQLPNELLAEMCRAVVPFVGIWDDDRRRPPAALPRHNSNILVVSASMHTYLRPKFLVRKAIEIEQREKCCQICAQLAWGSCRVGPNKKICIGCKCFFLRCLRDKTFAGGDGCKCNENDGTNGTAAAEVMPPQMCKWCRLNKCVQIGLLLSTMTTTARGPTANRKRTAPMAVA